MITANCTASNWYKANLFIKYSIHSHSLLAMSNLHTFHIIKYLSGLHFQGFESNTSLSETDNA